MPTQNLKTRIADAIYRQSVYRDKTDNEHTVELMFKILSSELSLAINELREAMENMEYCPACYGDEHKRGWLHAYEEATAAFDIKYKELQEKV